MLQPTRPFAVATSGHGPIAAALLVCLLCLLAGGAPVARALPDDREQPIHITADKAVRDEQQGVTIYTGNVQMRQGSMELDADSLTIYHEARDANKIVAHGAPAEMRQRPEIDKGLVYAYADVITYYRSRELIHLRTSARLKRDDGTLVTGDSIDYFITRELVKAESDRNDSANKVVVVIPPSLLEDDNSEDNSEGSSEDNGEQPAEDAPAEDGADAGDTADSAAQEGSSPGGATQSE